MNNMDYFAPRNAMKYFSVSQLKSFNHCEAKALAEAKGEWKPESSTALLQGSYVDAFYEGTLDDFRIDHPEMFKKDGNLKADYVKCDEIIGRTLADPLFQEYMSGEKQKIMVGKIDGFDFKIKMDSYHMGDKIVDLKVMRSMDRIAGMSFVDYWDYNLQGAVYREIEKQNTNGNYLPFFLAVATKETPIDIEVIELDPADMEESLDYYRKKLPRWQKIKNGEIEPDRCGRCAYCKETKKLKKPIPAAWVGFTNAEIRAMEGDI